MALELVDHLDLEGQRNIPHGNRGTEEMAGSPVSGPSKPGSKATVAEVLRQKSLCTLVICQRFSTPMWLGCGTCSQTNVVI